jgi:hypothetical protein
VALIADRIDDFRSLVALLGLELPEGSRGRRAPPRSARTIGPREALTRAGAFLPALGDGRERRGLEELFEQRNNVGHLGATAARDEAERLRGPFVAACD